MTASGQKHISSLEEFDEVAERDSVKPRTNENRIRKSKSDRALHGTASVAFCLENR